jgi:hypothetical protein
MSCLRHVPVSLPCPPPALSRGKSVNYSRIKAAFLMETPPLPSKSDPIISPLLVVSASGENETYASSPRVVSSAATSGSADPSPSSSPKRKRRRGRKLKSLNPAQQQATKPENPRTKKNNAPQLILSRFRGFHM